MRRREMLKGAATLAILAATRPAAAGEITLRTAVANSNRLYGSAVQGDILRSDTGFRELILKNCSSITPELALKWAVIEPSRNEFDFTQIDYLADFADSNGMALYGHTLLWHESIPQWAMRMLATKPDWGVVYYYMDRVLSRLGHRIKYWDVVNEPMDTGYRTDGLRGSPFLTAFGPEYISNAFYSARELAPAARLMLNEFGFEYYLDVENDRRYLFLKLLESLRKNGTPIDGVGLQAHLDLRKGQLASQKLKSFLGDITDLGLELYVTELDVKEANYAQTPERRDQEIADAVSRYMDVVLPYSNLRGVTTWGITDRYSWLTVTSEELEKYGNIWKNGTGPGLNRGLPFDAALVGKLMRNSLCDSFASSEVKYVH